MVHVAVSEHHVLFHYPAEQEQELPFYVHLHVVKKPIFISQIYGLESTLTESLGGCSLPNSFI